MKTVIKNVRIFNGESIVEENCILLDNGRIEAILNEADLKEQCLEIDGTGNIIAPAFVDLQVNGGGGRLLTAEPTIETLRVIASAHKKYGVLYTLPTLISTDLETILAAIEAVKCAQKEDIGIIGLHLEGPFLFGPKGGIHEKKYIHECSIDELKLIVDGNEKAISQITVAPESCSKECLDYLVKHGIKVFIGHSNATLRQCQEFFELGASGVTHLYNAMSQLGSREPGVVGASLISDTWAGIIADGFHVNFASIEIAKKIKGDKLYLVTDAMPPVGIGDLDFKIGETEIHCRNNKCLSNDGTIAGSALNMNKALQNIVSYCHIDIEESLRMTSSYQAQMLGREAEFGFISPGMKANLVFLDQDLMVTQILKNGEIQL